MTQILLGGILLSVVHALIPNHWLPFVALARSEDWSARQTLSITAICGAAHTLSTILIGFAVGFLGYEIAERFEAVTHTFAPMVLIVAGIILIGLDIKGRHHHHHWEAPADKTPRSTLWLVSSLCLAMFFSPCLEIEAYFFTAGVHGWAGILLLSSIYFLVTIAGMVTLVSFALHGVRKLEWHFLEHHERLFAGAILLVLGVVTLFLGHHGH